MTGQVTVRLGRKASKGANNAGKAAKPGTSQGQKHSRGSRDTTRHQGGNKQSDAMVARSRIVPTSGKTKQAFEGEGLTESGVSKARVVRGFLQSPGGFNTRAARKCDNGGFPALNQRLAIHTHTVRKASVPPKSDGSVDGATVFISFRAGLTRI